jgi:hypothetical protein
VTGFVERAHVVGPDTSRVHDDVRPHLDLCPVGLHACAAHTSRIVLPERCDAGVVRHDRTVRGGSPAERERQAGVVRVRVVVEVAAGDAVGPQRLHVRHRLVRRDALVSLADA